jgi:NADH:ubiquinone oxidoreductase subunit 3 (subunit A)
MAIFPIFYEMEFSRTEEFRFILERIAWEGSRPDMQEYIIIGVFALVGILFAGAAMVFSRIIAPRFPDAGKKLNSYESGEDAIGSARIQFKIGYYLFALVFLVFDVEAVFLFPVLGVVRSAGGASHLSPLFVWCELLVFVSILAFALFYAWKKKVLEWE